MGTSAQSLMLMIIKMITSVIEGQWISPEIFLPKEDRTMAPGYYKGVITLIGGYSTGMARDVIEYNITDNSFKYHSNALEIEIWGTTQYWAQIDNAIYIPIATGIHRYDLVSKNLELYWNNITIPYNSWDACIASSNEALYIVGGDIEDLFQIYNISSNKWSLGPNVNTQRIHHGCAVSPIVNTLYAIAGESNGTRLDTVEYISIIDLHSWNYTHNTLSVALDSARAVAYDIYVYIIGGYGTTVDNNGVHIINVLNHTISVPSDKLVYWVVDTAPIVVEQRLYAFGGGGSTFRNAFQYYDLPDAVTVTTEPTTTETTAMKPTASHNITNGPTTAKPSSYIYSSTDINIITTNEPTTAEPSTNTATKYLTAYELSTHNTVINIPSVSTMTSSYIYSSTDINVITRSDMYLPFGLSVVMILLIGLLICTVSAVLCGLIYFIQRKKKEIREVNNMMVLKTNKNGKHTVEINDINNIPCDHAPQTHRIDDVHFVQKEHKADSDDRMRIHNLNLNTLNGDSDDQTTNGNIAEDEFIVVGDDEVTKSYDVNIEGMDHKGGEMAVTVEGPPTLNDAIGGDEFSVQGDNETNGY